MNALFVLFAMTLVTGSYSALTPIKHVVVLMMENRSFDHLLGFLKLDGYPELDGLTGLNAKNLYRTHSC